MEDASFSGAALGLGLFGVIFDIILGLIGMVVIFGGLYVVYLIISVLFFGGRLR